MKEQKRAKLYLLVSLLILSMASGNLFSQSMDVDSLAEKMDIEIQKTMLEGKIPSVTVALVSGDEIVWTGASGYSNLWAQTPAVPSTVYLIGSTFKTMSMFALLQQMEQGKFKLDDRVNDYLEDFKIKGEDPTNPVTFRHLLTHTSGLPEAYGAHLVWGTTVPPSVKDYLASSLKLQHPPMTKVIYSNMAYTLVAYLIEKFADEPYAKYIQEHIFNSLEMNDTAFMPRPDMEERLSVPYIIDNKTGHHVPTRRTKADVWPAGVVYGTVLNLANWLIANLNRGVFKDHRLISEATFQEVMTRQYDQFAGPIARGWLNETTGYGLTWWISERNGDKLFAHSGSVSGYTAFIAGNLDKKTGFAIMTNGHQSHPHLYKLAIKALDLLE
ncbi:MAG TPA: serine hydrolase domain-containing protein [Candidatus Heimdallarchaeota archaeon]|nr:serine hydrolase domain-containing protein [Candidatus Heimdallarchaeota archaeon]